MEQLCGRVVLQVDNPDVVSHISSRHDWDLWFGLVSDSKFSVDSLTALTALGGNRAVVAHPRSCSLLCWPASSSNSRRTLTCPEPMLLARSGRLLSTRMLKKLN